MPGMQQSPQQGQAQQQQGQQPPVQGGGGASLHGGGGTSLHGGTASTTVQNRWQSAASITLLRSGYGAGGTTHSNPTSIHGGTAAPSTPQGRNAAPAAGAAWPGPGPGPGGIPAVNSGGNLQALVRAHSLSRGGPAFGGGGEQRYGASVSSVARAVMLRANLSGDGSGAPAASGPSIISSAQQGAWLGALLQAQAQALGGHGLRSFSLVPGSVPQLLLGAAAPAGSATVPAIASAPNLQHLHLHPTASGAPSSAQPPPNVPAAAAPAVAPAPHLEGMLLPDYGSDVDVPIGGDLTVKLLYAEVGVVWCFFWRRGGGGSVPSTS